PGSEPTEPLGPTPWEGSGNGDPGARRPASRAVRSSFARKEALMATHPRRFLGSTLLAALALVGAACGGGGSTHPAPTGSGAAAARFPLTLTDDDGVTATLKSPPQRIVTFSPSDTEIVYALGLGDRLVGV